MLDCRASTEFKRATGQGDPLAAFSGDDFDWIAGELLRRGSHRGRGCGHADRGRRMPPTGCRRSAAAAPSPPPGPLHRHSEEPFLVEEVASTVGTGDATIAGFLAALLRGSGPEHALEHGLLRRAQNVRAVLDAVSGIHTWEETQTMIADWPSAPHGRPGLVLRPTRTRLATRR